MHFTWADSTGPAVTEGSDTDLLGAGYVTLSSVQEPSSAIPEPLPYRLTGVPQ